MRATNQPIRPPRGIIFVAVLLCMATFAAITNVTATDVVTEPVGLYRIDINNGSGGYNAFAVPMQTMRKDSGLISAVSSNVITVTCATCAGSSYWLSTALHYVEFPNGLGLGRSYAVQTNDATTITLKTGSEDLTVIGVAAGDRYIIHPYWRIQDVFGPANGGFLYASNNITRSDNVLIWNGAAFSTYWPNKTGGTWQPNGTDPILSDESMFIVRKPAGVTNIIQCGEVRVTNLVSFLIQGYNMVGNSYPAATTITNMNLLAAGTGFQGSNNISRSDNVLVWNGAAFDTLWYNTTAKTWQPSNSYPILPNATYFIYNKKSGGVWPRPLPYSP
jgi:uncharacterized protein (TIGR02597 family)